MSQGSSRGGSENGGNALAGVGDLVEQALAKIGVTSEKVERWLGRPCNCRRRKEKLNKLGWWAKRVVQGRVECALEFLNQLLEE